MFTKRIARTFLGVLSVALLVASSSSVSAQQSSTFVISFDRTGPPDLENGVPVPNTGAFQNPCTGEFVDATGTSTITVSQTIDKNGDVKTTVSEVTKGTGFGWTTGLGGEQLFSGSSYVFSDSQQFRLIIPSMGTAFDSTFSDKFALKGQKSIDNWIIRAYFRVKVSATGQILVEQTRVTEGDVCKG